LSALIEKLPPPKNVPLTFHVPQGGSVMSTTPLMLKSAACVNRHECPKTSIQFPPAQEAQVACAPAEEANAPVERQPKSVTITTCFFIINFLQ
jgi:hypothetical protein